MRNLIRSFTPAFLLEWNRRRKKSKVREAIREQASKGEGLTQEQLKQAFRDAGIQAGDDVLVHSSLSKIGYIEGGPETFIKALIAVVGPEGNILMPTSPNGGYQLDYIRNLQVFDVKSAPSALGKITEVFRNWPGSIRSASPTEPVSCLGPDAIWYTEGHLGACTPYTVKSPFARLAQRKGKILYIGVTLDNAGTSLHVLEDAVKDFKFPVYYPELFVVQVIAEDGLVHEVEVRVHNPEQSALRKCDGLLPLFKREACYTDALIGKASTMVFDAERMLNTMVKYYQEEGVTMYTPDGSGN